MCNSLHFQLNELPIDTVALENEYQNPSWLQLQEGFLEAISELILQSKTILNVNEAAEVLQCSTDTLQRIPVDALPSHDGVGRHILYFKSDLEQYVRSRRRVVKRGSGLSPSPAFIDHIPNTASSNPARAALNDFCVGE